MRKVMAGACVTLLVQALCVYNYGTLIVERQTNKTAPHLVSTTMEVVPELWLEVSSKIGVARVIVDVITVTTLLNRPGPPQEWGPLELGGSVALNLCGAGAIFGVIMKPASTEKFWHGLFVGNVVASHTLLALPVPAWLPSLPVGGGL
ncbi:hypothetical protein MTO96_025863 [Rhipicephalus appendiculatus]